MPRIQRDDVGTVTVYARIRGVAIASTISGCCSRDSFPRKSREVLTADYQPAYAFLNRLRFQDRGGRRRTLVTSLPVARMRAIAAAVASTATAM